MKKILIIGLGLSALFACKKKEPTACISADQTSVLVGEVVQFTNCSEDYLTSEWNFGDGENTNVTDPSHRFTESGNHVVNLKVNTKSGVSNETTSTIVVNNIRLTQVEMSDADISKSGIQFIASVAGIDLSSSSNVTSKKAGSSIIYTIKNPILISNSEIDIISEKQEETSFFGQTFWNTTDTYTWTTNAYKELGDKTSLTFENTTEGLAIVLTFEKTIE